MKGKFEYKEKTGISSLKVGYNRLFGYYIEVTKTHLEKVPDYYIRKQTLTNAERFFTTELKEYEIKGNMIEYDRGLSSFTSDEISKIKGQHSNKIFELLGYISKSEVIHKDDMVEI